MHLQCLSLAQELEKFGAEVRFFIRDLGLNYDKIVGNRYQITSMLPPSPEQVDGLFSDIEHALWAGVAQSTDAQEFSALVESFTPQLVVVDHYAFDAVWHDEVGAKLDCKMVAIDGSVG